MLNRVGNCLNVSLLLHSSRGFYWYWRVMWRFVTPLICVLILGATWFSHKPMSYDGKDYPEWANHVGWAVSFVSVSCIPLAMIYKLLTTPGTLKQVNKVVFTVERLVLVEKSTDLQGKTFERNSVFIHATSNATSSIFLGSISHAFFSSAWST